VAVIKIYKQILAMRSSLADKAIVAALPTADAESLDQLAQLLFERGKAAGVIGLIQHLDKMPKWVGARLVDQAGTLAVGLREALRHKELQVQRAALSIILESQDSRLVHLVVDFLCHGTRRYRDKAASILLAITQKHVEGLSEAGPKEVYDGSDANAMRIKERNDVSFDDAHLGHTGETELSDQTDARSRAVSIKRVVDGVLDAVDRFAHHQQDAALFAFAELAGGPMSLQDSAFCEFAHPASRRFSKLIRQAEDPAVIRNLFAFLHVPGISMAVPHALTALAQRGRIDLALRSAHLLMLSGSRKALAKATRPQSQGATTRSPLAVRQTASEMADDAGSEVKLFKAETILPHREALLRMPASALRSLPQLVSSLPLSATRQIDYLAHFTAVPDDIARLIALRQMIEMKSIVDRDALALVVSRFCKDASEPIAKLAARFVLANKPTNLTDMLLQFATSPHAKVQAIASRQLGPIAFEWFWQAWSKLGVQHRRAAGSAMMKLVVDFHDKIKDQLLSKDKTDCLRAQSMVADLNQNLLFEEELIALTKRDDARVVASAVKGLGAIQSAASQAQVEVMLDHEDARVRANAIEALGLSGAHRQRDRLEQMGDVDAGRPRANALAELSRTNAPKAIEGVRRMLRDDQPGQRISALWLVQELGIMSVVGDVGEMALSDVDPQVRSRAGQTVKGLLDGVKNDGLESVSTIAVPQRKPTLIPKAESNASSNASEIGENDGHALSTSSRQAS
jgi:hypothetical protein